MKNIVVTADLHLHNYRQCSKNNGMDRLQDGLSAMRQTLDHARSNKAFWIFCGDMKMPKTFWPQEALTGAIAVFQEYADVLKILFRGNHDGLGKYGSGLAPFASLPNTTVIEDAFVDIKDGLAFWPFGATSSREQFLGHAKINNVKTLFSHGFMAGVFLGPDEVRLPGKGMTLDEWGIGDVFKAVFLGDVHKGQWLTRPNKMPPKWVHYSTLAGVWNPKDVIRQPGPWRGEVFYPGSPYQQSWGEANDPTKGCLLVDLDSGTVRLLPVHSPRFVTVSSIAIDRKMTEGNFVRIIGNPTQSIESLNARWAYVLPRPKTESVQRTDLNAGMSNGELIEKYVTARPVDGVSNATLVAAGKRLLP